MNELVQLPNDLVHIPDREPAGDGVDRDLSECTLVRIVWTTNDGHGVGCEEIRTSSVQSAYLTHLWSRTRS
jgi:hypothetical protein